MDVSSHFSDPIPYGSGFWAAADLPERSDGGSSRPANFSDEEVILASSHPKKRAGRKKFRETRHPVYRGVRRRNSGKWVCEVREPNKKSRIWLGTFPTEEMAARAHDVAAIALRGRLACLNFADSAWRLPVPASTDPKDIRKAAAEAAEAFRPSKPDSGKQEDSEVAMPGETVFFMDEAVFEWPGLLGDMAKGLMMPPPECSGAHGFSGEEVESDAEAELPLWSFSM